MTPEWLDSPFPGFPFPGCRWFHRLGDPTQSVRSRACRFLPRYCSSGSSRRRANQPRVHQFTQPLDLRSLPRGNTDATVSPESSVFLVDIDPSSPERGSFIPFRWTWNSDATPFLPSYTLSVAPSWGRPLRPDTLYAWVFTRALRASTGESIERAPWSRALLADAP